MTVIWNKFINFWIFNSVKNCRYVHSAVITLTRVMRTIIRVIARATEERITATRGSIQVSVNRSLSSSLDWLSLRFKFPFESSSSFLFNVTLCKSSFVMFSLFV